MTLRRIANWIVGIPVAVVAIGFAVANRQWIVVSFDPFNRDAPYAAVNMPLWVLFFCGIFVGLIAGWIAAWFSQGRWRKAARDARIEAMRLGSENDRLKRESEGRGIATVKDASL